MLLSACAASETKTYHAYSNDFLIAHAGGGVVNDNYTNSLEALNQSSENGFQYIEIDFTSLEDGNLVLLHGWKAAFEGYYSQRRSTKFPFEKKELAPVSSIEDFKNLKMRGRLSRGPLSQMSLNDLLTWLEENPNIYIITDFKESNYLDLLLKIKAQSERLQPRFIPQIYKFEDYEKVREMGYTKVILTIYKMRKSIPEVLSFGQSKNLFAITIPKNRINNEASRYLLQSDLLVFTHTVNSLEEARNLTDMGVDGFYTDNLYPLPTK